MLWAPGYAHEKRELGRELVGGRLGQMQLGRMQRGRLELERERGRELGHHYHPFSGHASSSLEGLTPSWAGPATAADLVDVS